MARLTPPTKIVFNISIVLGVISLILYFVNVFDVAAVSMNLVFWIAAAAWGVMTAGVCMKGV
jgi:Na+-transporting NADH:ubiquinone oxidoreductase subunit NqrB